MERINPQTKDLTQKNINQIAQLFPQVLTEKEDENGNIVKAIDFELLKQHLSKDLVEGSDERYRLDWPGKRRSILKANTPIISTLKPDRDSSVNFDTTENLYIEGDNFEVLKILQESYLGKIKMIYIDPPYNTGKDFVYKDNFKVSKEDYEEELGVKDEEGGKLVKNTDTNGRFHSDWLSMMYERLLVARDLLTDDGVIFMSIDDNEFDNLRKISDEIFGEENFIGSFCVRSTPNARDYGNIGKMHEYNLFYSKNIEKTKTYHLPDKEKKFKYNDISGDFNIHPLYNSNESFNKNNRPNLYYPFYIYIEDELDDNGFFKIGIEKKENSIEVFPPLSNKNSVQFVWRWGKKKSLQNLNKEIVGYKTNDGEYRIVQKMRTSSKVIRSFLEDKSYSSRRGTAEVEDLFNEKVFSFPKPVELIKVFLKSSTKFNDLILDFFSGSASTAHATMQLNAEDGGNRKFIMVQLPEETDKDSEAFKENYKTITEIGKERIRRAGKKILVENAEQLKERETPLDVGFRVYKTAPSILKEVAKHPNQVTQANLFESQDNIREDAHPKDILTAVLLDFDITLDQSIETLSIANSQVFKVADNALVACFDKNIDMQVVDTMANMQPIRAVFRDACFKDDKDLINTVESRFKQVSPDTKVHVI